MNLGWFQFTVWQEKPELGRASMGEYSNWCRWCGNMIIFRKRHCVVLAGFLWDESETNTYMVASGILFFCVKLGHKLCLLLSPVCKLLYCSISHIHPLSDILFQGVKNRCEEESKFYLFEVWIWAGVKGHRWSQRQFVVAEDLPLN